MQELDHYIDQIKRLPPAPTVLAELLGLFKQPNVDLTRVVDLITYDPSLTAEVLKLCNSAYFGMSYPADDISEAITRLGLYEVYRLVAAVVASRTLSVASPGSGLDAGELWRHSVTSAVAAQQVSQQAGDEPNVAFTAALLHDLGKIILALAIKDRYRPVVEATRTKGLSFLDAEKRLLGVQHAEIGGRLLSRWKFPKRIVLAVWFHHDPSKAHTFERLASVVQLANTLAHSIAEPSPCKPSPIQTQPEAMQLLGLAENDVEPCMTRTRAGLEALANLIPAAASTLAPTAVAA
jgi:putative nucleotidyltransferase with HDIG domain